jgi:hypothetical protein
MMKLRLATPEHVVDIGALRTSATSGRKGTRSHRRTTTHHQVESSAVLRQMSPAGQDSACIGRCAGANMGTVGGSVAHNDPAADYVAALFALEAEVELAVLRRIGNLPSATSSSIRSRRHWSRRIGSRIYVPLEAGKHGYGLRQDVAAGVGIRESWA